MKLVATMDHYGYTPLAVEEWEFDSMHTHDKFLAWFDFKRSYKYCVMVKGSNASLGKKKSLVVPGTSVTTSAPDNIDLTIESVVRQSVAESSGKEKSKDSDKLSKKSSKEGDNSKSKKRNKKTGEEASVKKSKKPSGGAKSPIGTTVPVTSSTSSGTSVSDVANELLNTKGEEKNLATLMAMVKSVQDKLAAELDGAAKDNDNLALLASTATGTDIEVSSEDEVVMANFDDFSSLID